jgi:regulator of RNase E activity RraA
MRAMGLRDFALPPEIRPLFPDQVLAGVVATVSGRVDTAADALRTLLGWTGLLSRARPGTVLICQPIDSTVALMGELSAESCTQGRARLRRRRRLPRRRLHLEARLPGLVPLFPRATSSATGCRSSSISRSDRQVTIRAGDLVLGDRDGMVILPRERAEEIVAAAEAAIGTENLIRKSILEGVDPQEAYLKYGKF